MNSKGKISIILPCYNSENYIADMLNDIQSQTYTDWELIVVSNGLHQEKQQDIIRRYQNNDNRIRLIHTDEGGVSNARNIGIESADGRWITFVDADDRIEEKHLQYYMDAVDDDSEVVIMGYKSFHNGILRDNMLILPKDSNTCGIDETARELLGYYDSIIASPCNKLFSSKLIKDKKYQFNTCLTFYEDAVFCLSVLLVCKRLQLIGTTSYHYMISGNSANSRYQKCIEEAYIQRENLYDKLFVKVSMPQEFIDNRELERNYVYVYFMVINMYKDGCNLTAKEKIQNIRRLMYNANFKYAKEKRKEKLGHGIQRQFDLGYDLLSPPLFHLWLTSLFKFRKLIKTIR